MMADPLKECGYRSRRCPKCGAYPDTLVEKIIGEILWDVEDGVARDVCADYKDVEKVTAHCGCGHIWRLRGILMVTQLHKVKDGGA